MIRVENYSNIPPLAKPPPVIPLDHNHENESATALHTVNRIYILKIIKTL